MSYTWGPMYFYRGYWVLEPSINPTISHTIYPQGHSYPNPYHSHNYIKPYSFQCIHLYVVIRYSCSSHE